MFWHSKTHSGESFHTVSQWQGFWCILAAAMEHCRSGVFVMKDSRGDSGEHNVTMILCHHDEAHNLVRSVKNTIIVEEGCRYIN